MIDQLEHDLRDAFAARAADVGPDAVARLSRVDYRPRRVGPPAAAGALAGTIALAALVVWLVGLGTGTSNAFAGWTPAPTTGSSAQNEKAQTACAARLPADAHGTKPVLSDTRGPFTVRIYSNTVTCMSGPNFTSVSGARMTHAFGYGTPQGIAVGGIHMTTRDGQPYTMVQGRAGDNVKSATLVLSDGARVKATVANGWFAAWWPGARDAVRAELATPSGTRIQPLPSGAPVCRGPGPCTLKTGHGSGPGLHVGP
jgi:hypothetical protein